MDHLPDRWRPQCVTIKSSIDADVVVVGAGISGIASAKWLHDHGRRVIVLEQNAWTGGRIRTERRPGEVAGAYLQHGGIFHTDQYPRLCALIEELGLGARVQKQPSAFNANVLQRGQWRHVDYGSLLAPIRFSALGWLDSLSLLRAAAPILATGPPHRKDDFGTLTSMQQFDEHECTRGLTSTAADYFAAGPHEFLWGVRSNKISKAMLALQLQIFKGDLKELQGGTQALVELMAKGLDVRHETQVHSLSLDEERGTVAVTAGSDEQVLHARAVVLACQAPVAARLWPQAPSIIKEHLEGITYSRIDYIYVRTSTKFYISEGQEIGMEVVPAAEVDQGPLRTIGGVYCCDSWIDAGQEGSLLLVTTSNAADAAAIDDDALATRLQEELEHLHPQLKGNIVSRSSIIRHDDHTPTFSQGTVGRLSRAQLELESLTRDWGQQCRGAIVDLAGDHMAAPWMEGALYAGQKAAQRVHSAL